VEKVARVFIEQRAGLFIQMLVLPCLARRGEIYVPL
jgi:hypothetical protein